MRVVFWGKFITFHQLETLRAFEELTNSQIQFVLMDPENQTRLAQGWRPPQVENIISLNSKDFWRTSGRVLQENTEAIHIFFSFWGSKKLFLVLLQALWLKRRVMVILEPYATSPRGYWHNEPRLVSRCKVLIRKIAYRMAHPLIQATSGKQAPCILAVSGLAQEQLLAAGFHSSQVYPFGYFVHKTKAGNNTHAPVKAAKNLRLVYAGSLLEIKGLDILSAALRKVNQTEIRIMLDVYGSGDIKTIIAKDTPGLTHQGRYKPNDAQTILRQYDALVIPSRHEGWGVVANEALLQGVPVIISDRAGAKCLVENSGAGMVFESENTAQLAGILGKLAEQPGILANMRQNALLLGEKITPEVGARYLADTINFFFLKQGDRPSPTWLTQSTAPGKHHSS